MKKTLFALLFFTPLLALAGNEGGHGGDPYAYEFVELGKRILAELRLPENLPLALAQGLDLDALEKKIMGKGTAVWVHSQEADNVKLKQGHEDVEVDAINFPEETPQRALLNRTRLREALLDQKLKLNLHEYFCFLELECDVYNKSIFFAPVLAKLYRKLLADPDTPVRYFGMCIGSPPLYRTGDPCDKKFPSVSGAVSCAEEEAISRCQSERGRPCQITLTEIKRIRSTEHVGFEYCQVTSLAK